MLPQNHGRAFCVNNKNDNIIIIIIIIITILVITVAGKYYLKADNVKVLCHDK